MCAHQAFHRLTGNDGAGNAFSWSFGQRFGQQQTKLEALVFEPRQPLESWKGGFPDPAAAPLVSDEEAGEMTTLEEAKEKAYQAELRRAKNTRRDDKKSG